jgi:hypothetical protein
LRIISASSLRLAQLVGAALALVAGVVVVARLRLELGGLAHFVLRHLA